LKDRISVKYGRFDNVLVTKEWTPLEPDIVENKYYAKGVGFIFGIMVQGGDEQTELVRIRQPERDDDDDRGDGDRDYDGGRDDDHDDRDHDD
jgi:hypothetical protein